MKLSDNTMSVLKNFSQINNEVMLKKGKVQRTMAADKNVLFEATIEDALPNDFGIYDINQFLGNVVTMENPDLTFSEEKVLMSDSSFTLTYWSAHESVIKLKIPDQALDIAKADAEFDVPNTSLQKIMKLALMNDLPNISFVNKSNELFLVAHNKATTTEGTVAETRVGSCIGPDFTFSMKTSTVVLLPDDYHVKLSFERFAMFVNKSQTFKYIIAFDSSKKKK